MRRRILLSNKQTIPVISGTANGIDWIEIDGVKWATKLIGQQIGKPQYAGWGESVPYNHYSGRTRVLFNAAGNSIIGTGGSKVDWSTYNLIKNDTSTVTDNCMVRYNNTDGYKQLYVNDEACQKALGQNWRTPSISELDSLLKNNNISFIYDENNNKGFKIESPYNPEIKIELYPQGQYKNYGATGKQNLYLLSRNRAESSSDTINAQCAIIYSTGSTPTTATSSLNRYIGLSLLAVYNGDSSYYIDKGYVDLKLPSGLKWARFNLGADSYEEFGFVTQYGYADTSPYAMSGDKWFDGNICPSSADTVTKYMGSPWRLPTKAECQELLNNTTQSIQILNCHIVIKFTSKIDSSKVLYIPAAGYAAISSNNISYAHGDLTALLCTSETNKSTHYPYYLYIVLQMYGGYLTIKNKEISSYEKAYMTPMRGVRT